MPFFVVAIFLKKHAFLLSLFLALLKHFFTLPIGLGVKKKVLGIEPRKILRPDPGLYSQYFPSYDIFGEPQIFRHPIFNRWFCTKTKIWLSQKMA